MKFLERSHHHKIINRSDKDHNEKAFLQQDSEVWNFKQKNDQSFTYNHVTKNIGHQNVSNNKKSQIPSFFEIFLRYFQDLKVQLNDSLNSVIRVLVDRISLESETIQNIESHKQSQNQFSIKQINRIKQAVQHLKKQLEIYQELFNKRQDSFLEQSLSSILKNSQIKTNQHLNVQKTGKLQHVVSQSPRFFNPKKPINQNQQNPIQFQYKLQNKEEQNTFDHQPIKIRIRQQQKNPQKQKINRSFQQKQQLLTLEQYQNQKTKSSLNIQSNKHFNLQYLNVNDKNKRKLSINLSNDDQQASKINQNSNLPSKNFHLSSKNYRLRSEISEQLQKTLSIEMKSPMQKLQQIYRQDIKKINLNNHYLKSQANQQFQSFENISLKYKTQNSHDGFKDESKCKNQISINYQKNSYSLLKKNETKPDRLRKHSFCQNRQQNNDPEDNQSFWAVKQQNLINQSKNYFKNDTKSVNLKCNPILNLNQLRSAALYIESLNLPINQKIEKLKRSLQYDEKNLSAAQILSSLLFKNKNYKECLDICNHVLGNFIDEDGIINKNQQSLVYIISNKSAALNQLGRYSQTIKFIEKMNLKNSNLIKNLADAYSSLGKIDRAIIEYKKCLQYNQQNDEVLYNLAACYFMNNSFSDALQPIIQALKINENQAQYIELFQHIKPHIK